MQRRPGGLALVAAALAVIGGIAATVGSLLSWAEASVGPASFTAKGIDGWEGKVTVVGGVVLLVGGIAAFLGSVGGVGRLRTSALVGGIAAAGVGAYTALTATSQIVDAAASEIAKETGVPVDQGRSTVQLAFDQGVIHLTLQVGLWLVIVGGVLGIVAGVIALAASRQTPPAPEGLRGWDAPADADAPAPPVAVEEPGHVEEPGPGEASGASAAPRGTSDTGWEGDTVAPATVPREPSTWVAPPPPRPGDAPLVASVWAIPEPAEPAETAETAETETDAAPEAD
jgi:hypothetical protein